MNTALERTISNWPEEPRRSAERLIEYYGEPHEFSDSQLIWRNTNDGWKRTVLSRDEVPHNFPAPHTDFLEQFIDYKVPVEFYSKLAGYDGSLMIERTKGEMSARCGGTAMNFVAINLAHDIINGCRTVGEARAEYARLYQGYKIGKKHPYTQKFNFELPRQDTGDPDVAFLTASA